MKVIRWALRFRLALRLLFWCGYGSSVIVATGGAVLAAGGTIAIILLTVGVCGIVATHASLITAPVRRRLAPPPPEPEEERPRVPWQADIDRYLSDSDWRSVYRLIEDVDDWEATKWPRPWRLPDDATETKGEQ